MLTKVLLENFKAFGGRHEVPLAPLTLIFGQNSAGKSTIIQSLLLLKQSMADVRTQQLFAQPRLVTQGELTDLGTFPGLRHGGTRTVRLGFECTSDLKQLNGPTVRFDAGTVGSAHVSLSFDNDRATSRAVQREAALGLGDGPPIRFRVEKGAQSPRALKESRQMTLLEASAPHVAQLLTAIAPQLRASASRSGARPAMPKPRTLQRDLTSPEYRAQWQEQQPPWSVAGFFPAQLELPKSGRTSRARAVNNEALELALQVAATAAIDALQRIHYIGPLRAAPTRVHEVGSERGESIGTSGEFVTAVLTENQQLLERVNEWLKRFGIPYEVRVENIAAQRSAQAVGELKALLLEDEASKVVLSPRDVGFGISQVLPVVVQLVASEGLTVCIEQPEIHLHPRLQAELGDLLIEATDPPQGRKGRAPAQVIAETHSEHLILRIQRRIREGKLEAERVAVIYVDRVGRRTKVHQLRLDARGEFVDEWPQGFFEERMTELFAGV